MPAIDHFIIRDFRLWLLSRCGVSTPRLSLLFGARASDTAKVTLQASASPAQLDVSVGLSARTAHPAAWKARL